MDFRLTRDELAFRDEVAAFLEREVTEDVVAEVLQQELGPKARRVLRKLGQRRWLAVSWPEDYGGMNAPLSHAAIVEDLLAYYRVLPTGRLVGLGVAGPMIMRFGSDEQKRRYLTAIARGEIEFCVAYTEPQAGSDLASLQTRAWRDGDDYVVEGQKLFNTRAHYSAYHWLVARTDSSGSKHQGLSLFIIDSKSEGISVRPLTGLSGKRTNEVFYDRVRVPAENLVGEENHAWEYLTSGALAFERVFPVGDIRRELSDLIAYIQSRGGLDDPEQRDRLADAAIRTEVGYLLAQRVSWMQKQGRIPGYEADVAKIFLTELWQHVASLAMQVQGLHGAVERQSRRTQADGRADYIYMDTVWRTIAGGTSEVVRNMIAIRGLGLPRG